MPRLLFKYPPLKSLLDLTPKERVAFTENKFQHDLARIRTKTGKHEFQIIGTKRKPRGIEIKCDKRTWEKLSGLPFIDKRLLTTKSGKSRDHESYFCCKLIIQIQVEGRRKGSQTIEERFVLVKADSFEKAEAKVIKEIKKDEDLYLNPFGQLVRWKFESIEESYHPFITGRPDFNKPVEVFSGLRTRKLKKENIWKRR